MDLEELLPDKKRSVKHIISNGQLKYIVLRAGRFTASSSLRESDEELGRVVYGPGGAKLEAVQSLHILPGHPDTTLTASVTTDLHSNRYELKPASDGRCEIMLLRHGDAIGFSGIDSSLLCVEQAFEVQVNSSAAELDHLGRSDVKDGVADTPEDETEDEAAPDDTITEVPVTQPVTQPTKSQPSATPRLHEQGSTLVQETPTIDRMVRMNEYDVAAENGDRHVEPTPPPQGVIAIAETFSTARTGQSPQSIAQDSSTIELPTDRKRLQGSPEVRVNGRSSRKRQSPAASPERKASAEVRSTKRVKKTTSNEEVDGDTVQPSPLDDINADPSRKTYSVKGKRPVPQLPETTPSKSARSSQRSATATTAVAYEGEPPRVATSNSAIKDGSSTVKFLRKHGGTLVGSVEDKCNVLCVRDSGLAKTMKVIQAIALGIPIVTDKWLSESARTEAFLDLSSFKPSVAQQEEEWGFNFEKVWGVAQTPFKGYSIYFTPALKKTYTSFSEMDRVCQTVGAKVVSKRAGKNDKIIVLATETEDPDADKMIEDGETCYHKDLLTTSILRGTLDLDSDEFKVKAKPVAGLRRRGPRKST